MNKSISTFTFMLLFSGLVTAQHVGIGTTNPNASAALDVSSASRGFLPPRMTYSQRNAIANPAAGLMVYCTNCDSSGQLQLFNGTQWTALTSGPPAGPYSTPLPSVTIGNQVWMTQNLSVDHYTNGDPIPYVSDPTQWSNLTTGAWCWYFNYSANNAQPYGRLYNWFAVNDPRGLAPTGWHVPSDAEWNKLVRFLDASIDTTCSGCPQSYTAGGMLKETGTTHWFTPNVGATNSTGFTARAGGYRYVGGNFSDGGYYGYWWSSTESASSNTTAFFRQIFYSNTNINRNSYPKTYAYSVRCVKD